MGRRAARVRQHGTHSVLTRQAGPGSATLASLRLDAIIVPGSRPAPSLDHAVTLARAADCWLLILCSQRLHGWEVKEFLAERAFRKAIVIDLPPGYSHELLEFPELRSVSKELPPEYGFYVTDLSMKRNIGLVLAKMLGWRRVFFLDDDIRDIAYPDLQATVGMLGSFPAVGMWVTDFPDNSIVCHANRQTEGSQDVFVSGAALAVECDAGIGFFPDIYNEDWLFFFDDASNRRLANSGKKATQLIYYPFANAKRAAWQEFGDVLAEGLYSLLHLGLSVADATPGYWASFLQARRSFLNDILTRSQNADPAIRGEMVESVEAALECLGQIKPELCARYVQSWQTDLRDWKRRMAEITEVSLEDALAKMRLAPTAPASNPWRVMPHWAEATPGPVAIPQIDTLKQMSQGAGARPRSTAITALATTMPLEVAPDMPLEAISQPPRGPLERVKSLLPGKSRGSARKPVRASAEVSPALEAAEPVGSGQSA
jgi:hypothetical protein